MTSKSRALATALACLFALPAVCGAQSAHPKLTPEKVELFQFDEVKGANPNQITPRKWNWEIKLTPEQSRRRFRIVQETVGKNGPASAFNQVLFNENGLQKNPGDIIHFRLHTGDEKPTLNLNKAGNVGLGVSFSRVGGGYGSSGWIVLPGKILKSEIPRRDVFINGELVLVSFETIDPAGNRFKTDLKLAASP